ncbi:MAG: hypothetical protein WHT65_09665 [Pseudothermotoga sp.]
MNVKVGSIVRFRKRDWVVVAENIPHRVCKYTFDQTAKTEPRKSEHPTYRAERCSSRWHLFRAVYDHVVEMNFALMVFL